jgi:hypothetical protein
MYVYRNYNPFWNGVSYLSVIIKLNSIPNSKEEDLRSSIYSLNKATDEKITVTLFVLLPKRLVGVYPARENTSSFI